MEKKKKNLLLERSEAVSLSFPARLSGIDDVFFPEWLLII